MPSPAAFDKLKAIYLENNAGIAIDTQDIWKDDERLFLSCLTQISDSLMPWAYKSVGQWCYAAGAPLTHLRWVPEMIKKLKTKDANKKVRVYIEHRVRQSLAATPTGSPRCFGTVVHDVMALDAWKTHSEDNGKDTGGDDGDDKGENDSGNGGGSGTANNNRCEE